MEILKKLLEENTHIQSIWINELGEYYLANPFRLGFVEKTRTEILEIKETKKVK